ncbi:hypothetical protein AYO41_05095 [Verrucomicrobia bacterium SCGC AG-212-E04]|nr:hypothetical protein AYO41_05095 [Verrucomicrobia bacterium SCGC AG-212-E04]
MLGNARDVSVATIGEASTGGGWLGRARRSLRWGRREQRPLLVLNDGQDLEALGILATLEALIAADEIVAPVVVAIPTNRNRMMEYGISGRPDSAGRGARAGAYAQFVLTELLPVIRARFGFAIRPATTAVLGAPLGGLSAFDLAWRHPEVFGICGVFSGSFWWRADSTDARTKQSSRIVHRLVRESSDPDAIMRARREVRFWFQAGTEDETDDRDSNGVIDAIQDTTELIDELVARGWAPGRSLIYREVAGGRHEPPTWRDVFGEFARFAFSRAPTGPAQGTKPVESPSR